MGRVCGKGSGSPPDASRCPATAPSQPRSSPHAGDRRLCAQPSASKANAFQVWLKRIVPVGEHLMRCPTCMAENVAPRCFCAECGAPLPSLCPACGFEYEPTAKFCGGCGQPVGEAAAPAPASLSSLPRTDGPRHVERDFRCTRHPRGRSLASEHREIRGMSVEMNFSKCELGHTTSPIS